MIFSVIVMGRWGVSRLTTETSPAAKRRWKGNSPPDSRMERVAGS